MFKVQNAMTKKFVRDGITGTVLVYEREEDARRCADSQEYYSVHRATAWNSSRPTKYLVVPS